MSASPAADRLRAWLALIRAPRLGPVRLQRLLDQAGGDPRAVLAAGRAAWLAAGIEPARQSGLSAPDWPSVDADQRWLDAADHRLLTRDDADYPARLRELADAPVALFVVGDATLLAAPQIAIVGARAATAQGRENARAFAAGLVTGGFTVTSGLALGIDGAAHRGALDAGGTTLAVCGNGLDRVYPARHRELAHAIAASGALASEFPPGAPPRAEHFPRRNRVISGLSLGVLVVEGARASGSLITARLAAEQGREVFAIPGSIHNPLAAGCHALIRDGARLVESPADIFEELGVTPPAGVAATPRLPPPPADPLQARILALLSDAPVALEVLLDQLDADSAAVHEALLALELAGRVSAQPGDRYSRLDKATAGGVH